MENIIKNSFMEQIQASDISTTTILTMLFIVTMLGLYIYFIYCLIARKSFYSKDFAVSLIAVSLITSIIIIAVKSSIVISLGMVGALSIVRFRTPVKEPLDLAFIFWAISVGIICGANLYEIAIEGSIVITAVLLLSQFLPKAKHNLMLIVNAKEFSVENQINTILDRYAKYHHTRSRNYSQNSNIDLIIELKAKDEQELITQITKTDGVINASLMTNEGELNY